MSQRNVPRTLCQRVKRKVALVAGKRSTVVAGHSCCCCDRCGETGIVIVRLAVVVQPVMVAVLAAIIMQKQLASSVLA